MATTKVNVTLDEKAFYQAQELRKLAALGSNMSPHFRTAADMMDDLRLEIEELREKKEHADEVKARAKAEAAHEIAMMVRQDYGQHTQYSVSLLCSGIDGYANSFEREARKINNSKDGEQ